VVSVLLYVFVDPVHELVFSDDTIPARQGAQELARMVIGDMTATRVLYGLLDLMLSDPAISSILIIVRPQKLLVDVQQQQQLESLIY